MATQIKLRRDTAANWTSINPVLALGEPGLEIDTRKIKYGDGTTAWTSLAYSAGDANFSGNYTDLSNKPTIPDAQIQSDWTQSDNTLKDFIKNKPTLVSNLDSLSDVTITSATSGQVLKFNGTAWVNDTDSTGSSTGNITFSDTTMTSTNGDVKIHFSPSASPAVEFNFASNGTLTLPGGIVIQNNEVKNTNTLSGEVQITTATTQGDTEKNWTFNHNGTGALIVPEGSSVQSKSNFNITATETGFIKFTNIVDFDTNSSVDDNQISIVNPEASILDLIDPASANYVGGLGSVVRIVYGPFRSAVGTIIEAFADPGTTDPLTGLPRYQGRIDIVNPHNGDLLKEFSIEHSSSWKFGSDGNLTLPSNTSKINYANGTSILSGLGGGGGASLPLSNGNSIINIASVDGNITLDANGNVFTLGTDGNLTTPTNLVIGSRPGGGSSILQNDAALDITGEGSTAGVQLGWAANLSQPGSVALVAMNSIVGDGAGNVVIAVGNNATTVHSWLFGNNGKLTLPASGDIDIPNGRANVTGTANTVGGGATVGVRSILAIDSAFGSNDANDPASAQAIRGRVTGSNLTKTRNYVAGVTGQYLVTGTNASEFINTGLLGVVGDQTTTANAAVVAYLDGDGGLTTAVSAYGVSMKNSTPGSGFDYGLDLQFIDLNVAGTTTPFKQADIRFNNGALQRNTGLVPCAGGASTIVYVASADIQHTIKLLIQVEGLVGAETNPDTQSCEMIIAKSFRGNNVASTVYAVVHTSVAPLATFTALWDGLINRVEVICTPTGANAVDVKTFATEITAVVT
jgi:hypothetical protein